MAKLAADRCDLFILRGLEMERFIVYPAHAHPNGLAN
jgi:hypothetical protein